MTKFNPQTQIEKKGVRKIRRNRFIALLLMLFFVPSLIALDSLLGSGNYLRNYGACYFLLTGGFLAVSAFSKCPRCDNFFSLGCLGIFLEVNVLSVG
jgi:hypothetical protein